MNNENAIEVYDVKKKFKIYYDKGSDLKDRLLFRNRSHYEDRWVLKGISLDIKKGEAVGLIGHNGCGKSTLLKLLTRILYPDSGTIQIQGRVSSLIELGAGFHPDMSGRENIYTNASIFGLTKKEIDARLSGIIAFSELEEFIDNPVRTYSSGMYMRLAFSVAINVDANILLIDEILAVGDANFQAKCFNKLQEIKASGTTIVIVSHSLGQIEQICERSVWIQDGNIQMQGKPREVHPAYLDFMGQQREVIAQKEMQRQAAEEQAGAENAAPEASAEETAVQTETQAEDSKRWGNGFARIKKIKLLDKDKNEKQVFRTGSDITIQLEYQLNKPVKDAVIGIGIFRRDGQQCYGTNTRIDKLEQFDLTKSGTIQIHLTDVALLPAQYLLDIAIESDEGVPVDYYREAISFEMYAAVGDVGVARINHEWEID